MTVRYFVEKSAIFLRALRIKDYIGKHPTVKRAVFGYNFLTERIGKSPQALRITRGKLVIDGIGIYRRNAELGK